MRDIKFRAWDINEKSMFQWEEIEEFWEKEGYSKNIFRSDHWIPMQFTGLKDNNGKEIYEGDILKYLGDKPEWGKNNFCGIGRSMGETDIATMSRFPVYWMEHEGFGNEGQSLAEPKQWAVIGNIYENPELIKS